MKPNHFAPALALSLVVALAGPSAEAQHRGGGGGGGARGGGGGWHGGGGSHGGGGGWHGGGGSHGGGYGYAVPRGSGGGGWHGGGVAGARHPQGGTGYYGRYYGGHGHYGGYGHYGGHYGGYYGGYYRPYYPYYYGGYWPYYGSSFALSFGWGSPYYYNVPPPYAGMSYSYAPSDSSGYSMQAPSYDERIYRDDEQPPRESRQAEPRQAEPPVATTRDAGSLRLEVRPEDTSVYVDDGFRGTAREARILRLGAGRHTIELVRPGYAIERHEVEIVTGERSDLLVEMLRPR